MKLYYAFGGGLGHLSRANAVIATLGQKQEDFVIVTNSNYAGLIFKNAKIVEVPVDYYKKPGELLSLIQDLIVENHVSDFYIDTFPNGIIGELHGLGECSCRLYYVARILNWDHYLPLIVPSKLNFDKTYLIESLTCPQFEFIKLHSKDFEPIDLRYPEGQNSILVKEILHQFKSHPWLIVHSGPFDELQILFSHALEFAELKGMNPEFLIITQEKEKLRGAHLFQINYFPANDFFPFCEKIFTACGFNSMHQTKSFPEKHHFIPFERRFDDQFTRARLRRSTNS